VWQDCDKWLTNLINLKRREGDRANAVLAAAGYNFSLLLRWLAGVALTRPYRSTHPTSCHHAIRLNQLYPLDPSPAAIPPKCTRRRRVLHGRLLIVGIATVVAYAVFVHLS
jgi:hypothetical protein